MIDVNTAFKSNYEWFKDGVDWLLRRGFSQCFGSVFHFSVKSDDGSKSEVMFNVDCHRFDEGGLNGWKAYVILDDRKKGRNESRPHFGLDSEERYETPFDAIVAIGDGVNEYLARIGKLSDEASDDYANSRISEWMDKILPHDEDWYVDGLNWMLEHGFKHSESNLECYLYKQNKDESLFLSINMRYYRKDLAETDEKTGWQLEVAWGKRADARDEKDEPHYATSGDYDKDWKGCFDKLREDIEDGFAFIKKGK